MIRLTTNTESGRTTVGIHGRLDAAGVDELCAVIGSMKGQAAEIDLRGVTHVDENGLRCLAALRANGVPIRGATLYIDHLLRSTMP